MSFLRHWEVYQVSQDGFCQTVERARSRDHALAHRLDETPVGYSWRVVLQQSPLPLRQPKILCKYANADASKHSPRYTPTLNSWSHSRGAPHIPPPHATVQIPVIVAATAEPAVRAGTDVWPPVCRDRFEIIGADVFTPLKHIARHVE
jgi:hypothetical protein